MRTPTITDVERRRRLGVRHHLADRAGDPVTVAGDLAGLHSSDPATPFLSTRARVEGASIGEFEAVLYEARTLVRILGMRRTMFVVPPDLGEVIDAACTKALAPAERRRLAGMLEGAGITPDGIAWITDVEARVMAALSDAGQATATELRTAVPELGHKISFGEGRKWAGQVGVSTRLLFLLATDGRIVRARPRGSWLSTQYRWAPTGEWLGAEFRPIPTAQARATLLTRWLKTFGPATMTDVRWWTGWTKAASTAALREIDAEDVDLEDGRPGFVLPGDAAPTADPGRPWVAFLPALDPTTMGWKERDWYLGDLASALFDRNGNAGPTIWVDGVIVGGWAHRPDGRVAVRLLTDVPAAARGAIHKEAADVESWLDGSVVIPRFRTPLERELSSGTSDAP